MSWGEMVLAAVGLLAVVGIVIVGKRAIGWVLGMFDILLGVEDDDDDEPDRESGKEEDGHGR